MENKNNLQISSCPICGFPWLYNRDIDEVAKSFEICPCCGCEYGYDDNAVYRQNWLQKGASWFNQKKRPLNWNLEQQLENCIFGWDELKFKK